MRVNAAAAQKYQAAVESAVEALPDLTENEQKEIVGIAIAHFDNHEGHAVPQQGILNLAHRMRSSRSAREEAYRVKVLRDSAWATAYANSLPEVKK